MTISGTRTVSAPLVEQPGARVFSKLPGLGYYKLGSQQIWLEEDGYADEVSCRCKNR